METIAGFIDAEETVATGSGEETVGFLNARIKEILSFVSKLIGIKYTLWLSGSTMTTLHPFYVDYIPPINYIKKHGINCAGLVNIMRLKNGKNIPGFGIYRGGTGMWDYYLNSKKLLEKFDIEKQYPVGTLFLRRYRNVEDQGHLAVLYGNNGENVLDGDIIHSYNDEHGGRVGITKLRDSHYCIADGYYEFICLPENWLYK